MLTLLHIDSSVDLVGSNTRRMSAAFVQGWCDANPTSRVLRRDLARTPPPPLDETFVRAVKTDREEHSAEEAEAWRKSEMLSQEFLEADRYVIGMPMHILTIPSIFKAYLEQVFHEDRVFRFTSEGPRGLLGGRKFLFLLSKGADYRAGAHLAEYDMLEPYLLKLLTFCGVAPRDIKCISLNNALLPGADLQADRIDLETRIVDLANTW